MAARTMNKQAMHAQAKQAADKRRKQLQAINQLAGQLFANLPTKQKIRDLLDEGRTSVVIDTCNFPKKENNTFIFPMELTHRFGVPGWYLYQGFPSDDYNGRTQLSPSTLPGGKTVVRLLNEMIARSYGKTDGSPVVKVQQVHNVLEVYLTWTREWAQSVCCTPATATA